MSRKASLTLAGAAVALAVGGGTLAAASIPSGNGTIHGCYPTGSAPLKVFFLIESAAQCPSGFTAISFNQAGQSGPPGAPGPSGPSGPDGAVGAVGITGVTRSERPFRAAR
ncbi:MAG TPA: hypothetical protein VGN35_12945 [Jatrophihabitantaceae bacterium]|nr:hypothetical protein [Jatrophihabitantaceae bacterium]